MLLEALLDEARWDSPRRNGAAGVVGGAAAPASDVGRSGAIGRLAVLGQATLRPGDQRRWDPPHRVGPAVASGGLVGLRLCHRVHPEVGSSETCEQPAERAGPIGLGAVGGHRPGHRARVPPRPAQYRLTAVGVEERECRMGQREHEWPLGLEHPVDLPEDPVEIVGGREAVHRNGRADRVGPNEARWAGPWWVSTLTPSRSALSGPAHVGDVLVDGDHPGTGLGQRHGASAGAAPEVEDPSSVDVSEQLELALRRQAGAVR